MRWLHGQTEINLRYMTVHPKSAQWLSNQWQVPDDIQSLSNGRPIDSEIAVFELFTVRANADRDERAKKLHSAKPPEYAWFRWSAISGGAGCQQSWRRTSLRRRGHGSQQSCA